MSSFEGHSLVVILDLIKSYKIKPDTRGLTSGGIDLIRGGLLYKTTPPPPKKFIKKKKF
jgi:hypothetical protein